MHVRIVLRRWSAQVVAIRIVWCSVKTHVLLRFDVCHKCWIWIGSGSIISCAICIIHWLCTCSLILLWATEFSSHWPYSSATNGQTDFTITSSSINIIVSNFLRANYRSLHPLQAISKLCGGSISKLISVYHLVILGSVPPNGSRTHWSVKTFLSVDCCTSWMANHRTCGISSESESICIHMNCRWAFSCISVFIELA